MVSEKTDCVDYWVTMVPAPAEKRDPWCCGMGKVSAKFLPSALVLVRLVTVKGDKNLVLDPKGELESPRKQEASSAWLYPSNPPNLHLCTPQIQG